MALLVILWGDSRVDEETERRDLQYMKESCYGERVVQKRGQKPTQRVDLGDREPIYVLAHGSDTDLAGESAAKLVERLKGTFGESGLRNRVLVLLACDAAQGRFWTALQEQLAAAGARKLALVGPRRETYTMTTGTQRVLQSNDDSARLSHAVEGKKGARRDEAAEPYLEPVGAGWRGVKFGHDDRISALSAGESGELVPRCS